MIFKTRLYIKKQFDTVHDFGIKNLIVSVCSFTYNNHETAAVTWPYYLKDIGGFDQVLDCSLPGAGNYHIANSLQWAIEMDKPDPNDSLVIVMWSGNDRDDYICPKSIINDYPFKFNYSDNVMSGITGGSHAGAGGNTAKGLKELAQTKTLESRAIENYLIISSLYNFLQNKGYKFIFLDYLDRSLPSRTSDFNTKKYLPSELNDNLEKIITHITDLYTWGLGRNYLLSDLLHPTIDGHLTWSKEILLPTIKSLLNDSI